MSHGDRSEIQARCLDPKGPFSFRNILGDARGGPGLGSAELLSRTWYLWEL